MLENVHYQAARACTEPDDPVLAKFTKPLPAPWGTGTTERVPLIVSSDDAPARAQDFSTFSYNYLYDRSTLPTIPLFPENESDWIIARRRNISESGLYRLPDEILLKIIKYLPHISILALLHVSPRFTVIDLLQGENQANPFLLDPWQTREGRDKALRILGAEYLCKACAARRKSGKTRKDIRKSKRQLYCPDCCAFHPRFLFPRAQQKLGFMLLWPWKRRVCHGLGGYVRLCAHKTIMWRDVESFLKLPAMMESAPIGRMVCTHRSHHPSDGDPHPPTASLMAYRKTKDNTIWLSLRMQWQVPLFDIESPCGFSRRDLERALDTVSRTALFNHTLCPHVSLTDKKKFLRPFSPDYCACFPSAARSTGDAHEKTCCRANCCLCVALKNPAHLVFGVFLPGGGRHAFTCHDCKAEYSWSRVGNRVYLRFSRQRWIRRPSSRGWVKSLAPETRGAGPSVGDPGFVCAEGWCVTNRRWDALVFNTKLCLPR